MNLLRRLKPFDRKSGNLNVIIETPKGCRNKYAFDFDFKKYRLKSVLPNGAVFPFDLGSIPGTTADDGDPLDVSLLGVIEAAQTSDGKTERNDRLIAVAAESHTHSSLKSLGMLDSELIKEIEHFFISYNQIRGKKFEPIARKGPHVATRLVKEHQKGKKKR